MCFEVMAFPRSEVGLTEPLRTVASIHASHVQKLESSHYFSIILIYP